MTYQFLTVHCPRLERSQFYTFERYKLFLDENRKMIKRWLQNLVTTNPYLLNRFYHRRFIYRDTLMRPKRTEERETRQYFIHNTRVVRYYTIIRACIGEYIVYEGFDTFVRARVYASPVTMNARRGRLKT